MSRSQPDVHVLIDAFPKFELHVHLEGTLEPALAMELAAGHGIELPYAGLDDLRQAYAFRDLQSFLDLYYALSAVLMTEDDFYRLTRAYLERAKLDGLVHVEPFFDPESHTSRGVRFETVITGICAALDEAQRELGITSRLIMCFHRHRDIEESFATLANALPFRDSIVGVGLDSTEIGNPPDKFTDLFARCAAEGFRLVAHSGEEGTAAMIWDTIRLLGVERIDHGVRCDDDPSLVAYLRQHQVPLTMCPLSNVRLKVFESLSDHNFKRLLDAELCVTINSDDPAYFGGYIGENFHATTDALALCGEDVLAVARNGVTASFLSRGEKNAWLAEIDGVYRQWREP